MSTLLATTRQRVLYQARELWRTGFVTFDTETTGLEWEDQIIQWAVCSQEGTVLGSGYVKPTVPISEGAFAIHGIREEQLANAPTFAEVWPTLQELITGKTVVIYNADFDIGKLWSSARAYTIDIPYDAIKSECAMDLFARFYGEVHEYWGTYTWQKLNEVAIPHLKIQVSGEAHHAAHDAAATAMIIKKLAELAEQELLPGWHPPVLVHCARCHQVVQECAEADEVWYCQRCGLEHGVFHRCPGCTHVVEAPASGFLCDDLCQYCHRTLHREKMLLTGAWHWCPDAPYQIVETADQEEPCTFCKQQREWKHQREEAERERQAKLLQKRKEYRRAYAKDYRKERREREQENRRRAELGLPELPVRRVEPVEEIIHHYGHEFERRKDHYGRPEVYCLKCEATWSKPPRSSCAGMKTYRSWAFIPTHLKTRTQLSKLHLKPAKDQKAEAVMEGSFGRYSLYDQHLCVPVERKQRARKKAASA
ncbi:MAG: 3'-5' exonuclease [Ktedonobacteraceae bacterium]